MTLEELRRETNRLCTIRLAGENPYAMLNEMQNHIEDLQDALDAKYPPLTEDVVPRACEAERDYVVTHGPGRFTRAESMCYTLEAVWPK